MLSTIVQAYGALTAFRARTRSFCEIPLAVAGPIGAATDRSSVLRTFVSRSVVCAEPAAIRRAAQGFTMRYTATGGKTASPDVAARLGPRAGNIWRAREE